MKVEGLNKIRLIILSSYPNMGKTTLALNIIRDIAINNNATTLFFSLEMSKELATKRISGRKTERKELANIHIMDKPNIPVEEITSTIRKMSKEQQIRLVVIDYIQLIKGYSKEKKAEIINKLQELSIELSIPIIAVAQL